MPPLPLKNRICDICQNTFEAKSSRAKRCSVQCRREYDKLRTRARPDRQIKWKERHCLECNAWVFTKKKQFKVCGKTCESRRRYRLLSEEAKEKNRQRHRKWHARTIGAERAKQRELLAPIKAEAKLRRKRQQSKVRYQQLKAQTCHCVSESILKAYEKGMCQYCNNRQAVEWDHIVPIAVGGLHCYDNLAPICKQCNRGWKRVSWNKVLDMHIETPFKCTQDKEKNGVI